MENLKVKTTIEVNYKLMKLDTLIFLVFISSIIYLLWFMVLLPFLVEMFPVKLDTHQCHCHITWKWNFWRLLPAISTYFVTNAKT
jgi:hypothetical protein